MKAYLSMWKNYTNFAGRAARSEYFLALLLNCLIVWALIMLAWTIPTLTLLASLYGFAICLPMLSLQIRRLRDAGKSWLWVFILAVPFFGFFIMILLACKESI